MSDNDDIRDDLAVVLAPHTYDGNMVDAYVGDVIDSILEAGWRPPVDPGMLLTRNLIAVQVPTEDYEAWLRWRNEGGAR